LQERIQKCEDDVNPVLQDDGCTSCRIQLKSCDLRPSEIPECTSTQEPEIVDGCISCKKALPNCHLRPNTIPFCETALAETQTINEETGCVSCRRKKKTCEAVPKCEESEEPTYEEGCPDCRKIYCTKEKIEAWGKLAFSDQSATKECELGEEPVRNTEACSLSCIRPSQDRCTDEDKQECRKNRIQPCDDVEEFKSAFDPTTCCFLCSRPEVDTTEKPQIENERLRCNEAQFKTSVQHVSVCQEDQRPEWDIKHCGPSCNRPERQCTKEQVARCYSNRPFCEPKQKPQILKLECCKSCKPEPKTCDPECENGFICTEKGCRSSVKRTFKIAIVKKELCDEIVDMSEDTEALSTWREWIGETVNRFCEKTTNQNRCQRYIHLAKATKFVSINYVEDSCDSIDGDVNDNGETVSGGQGEFQFEVEVAEAEDEDLVSLALAELEGNDIIPEALTACTVEPYSRALCRQAEIDVPLCSENGNLAVRREHKDRTYCCPCKPEPASCTVKVCDKNEEPDYEASCPCKPRRAIPKCEHSASELKALPVCAQGKRPELALDSKCPDCRLPICRVSREDIPECPADTLPSRDETTNCPTCRVATARPCSEEAQKRCAKKKDTCSKNQGPVCDKLSCCCSCYKPECNIKALRIPECAPDVKPTIDFSTGCPSCRRLICSKELAQKIPRCYDDEEPTRMPNGCQSCRKDICKITNRNEFADCQIGEEAEIDESSNCPTCMRPFCNDTEKAAIPFCSIERPQKDEATGCKTCKLPKCTEKPSSCTGNEKPELDVETGCMSCRYQSCASLRGDIPECQSDQTPTRKDDGCWSCRIPIPRCFLKKSEVRVCNDEEPSTDSTDGCPTCRLGRKDRLKCRLRPGAIPYCDESEKPSLIERTGCFSCRPKRIKCPSVRWCKDSQEPTKDENNCPSCRLQTKCTVEKLKRCHEAAHGEDSIIPECEPGVKPTRDEESCCLSCVPVSDCDHEAREECRKLTLEPCTDDEIGNAFDPVSCCRTCSRPKAKEDEKPEIVDDKVKCNKDKLRASLKNVPECLEGEKPEFDMEHCAPSCSRPARQCTKIQVAQCKDKMPFCEGDLRPTAIRGQCCPSCKKNAPTCGPVCGSDEKCVTQHVDNITTTACRGKKTKTFKMKVIDQDDFEVIKEMDKSEFGQMLSEIVLRHCDSFVTQEECKKNKDAAQDGLKVLSKTHSDAQEVEFSLEYAQNPKQQRRRRLLEQTDLVAGSLKNEEASDGMISLETVPDFDTSKTNAPTSTSPLTSSPTTLNITSSPTTLNIPPSYAPTFDLFVSGDIATSMFSCIHFIVGLSLFALILL